MVPIHTILFATDFSPSSDYAFSLASALARDYHARLLIAHVQELPTMAFGEFGGLPPDGEDAESARVRLLGLTPPDGQLDVKHLLTEGVPATQILKLADENGVDLIVVGSHGRRGLERLLMGSVAELVVRRAHCPVLVVKRPLPQHATDAEAQGEPAAVTP